MIPKIIHYCWFGKNPKNELINKCIESWQKYCPDYKIKEWNEDVFDININEYVRQAYENKKWAFVSDYVRLYALYTEGGIYLDTDAELTQNVDKFLQHKAFTSQEDDNHIPTALMGAERQNQWIGRLLSDYDNIKFVLDDGKFDLTTNVIRITNTTKSIYEAEFNNKHIIIGDDVHIYPKEYFCSLDIKRKDQNYCIHHFNGSWVDASILKKELVTYKNNYMTINYMINDMYNNNEIIKKFLGGKTFSIYGMGIAGKLLMKQCEEMNILPQYIIDKDADLINKNNILSELTSDISSDVLIITPIMYFDEIYEKIDKDKFKEVININSIYNKRKIVY